jgi:hypothetical protein
MTDDTDVQLVLTLEGHNIYKNIKYKNTFMYLCCLSVIILYEIAIPHSVSLYRLGEGLVIFNHIKGTSGYKECRKNCFRGQ